jgi:FkbM family methyltransferase
MHSKKVMQFWGLLDYSRFPRVTDKVVNVVIIGLALLMALLQSLVGETPAGDAFKRRYRTLMPRDMLVRYRDCLFLARRGHIDIHLLTPESEPHAAEVFTPDPGDVVVDMGAHAGKYTLPSANLVGPDGHVFAFEAIPDHFEALETNLELNGFSNVTTRNAATYDENRDMWLVGWDLKPDPDPDHPEVEHVNPAGSIPVETVAVDAVLAEHDKQTVDYVKIDIGRQELNAIRGMEDTLRASPDVTVLVEIAEENFEEVDGELTDLGFHGHPLDDSWGASGLRDYVYTKGDGTEG